MKAYQSHKRVMAEKIISVAAKDADGAVRVQLNDGTILDLPSEMTVRYSPQIGDYLVQYEDGYRSISPQKAFEDGYTPIYAPASADTE